MPWLYVRQRFQKMVKNINITEDQTEDGKMKYRGVVAALNRAYWGGNHHSANSILIGSWGKDTQVRPPRDIDLLFVPPIDIYYLFNQRLGNKQSQLLQDVANALRSTYTQTTIRGDGQVVVVKFDSYSIKVAPAFYRQAGGFVICDNNNGGFWKNVDPLSEITNLEEFDNRYHGNVKKLVRILKQWQRHCDVPIKSFHLEALIKEFLPLKSYGEKDEFWFDWLVRDAFAHMINRFGGGFWMPGCIAEWIQLDNDWLSKAQTAYQCALKACEYERDNKNILAGLEWQKIFGKVIPAFPI